MACACVAGGGWPRIRRAVRRCVHRMAHEKFHFNRARSFARYQDSLVRAIGWLKFEEMEPLADWFVDRLADVVRESGKALEAEVVVPAPLHRIRRRARLQPGRIAGKMTCQAAWRATSRHTFGEKAASSG